MYGFYENFRWHWHCIDLGITAQQRSILMFKVLIISFLALASSAFANTENPHLSIKERIRLSLWIDGIQEQPEKKLAVKKEFILPEEIERALKKL